MEKQTKDISLFSLVNLFLLTIAVICVFIFIFKYNENLYENPIDNIDTQENIENIIVVSENNTTISDKTTVEPVINKRGNEFNTEEIYNNKYYYNQLDEKSKIIYTYFENNIENMKSGSYTIKLPNSLSKIEDTEELNKYFQSAVDALMMDRVDLFYIDISKISLTIKTLTYGADISRQLYITPNNNENYLDDYFSDKEKIDNVLNSINNVTQNIISNAYGNQYEQVKFVHNWLIDNLEYDSNPDSNSYNIYGALINKKAVCEGYAEAFKYIMDRLNIPCVLISGTATNSSDKTENHEWNAVRVNGNWYAIDVTWDDPIIINGGKLNDKNRYKYFLKGSSNITTNHFANGKFSNSGIEFAYPELQYIDY